MLSPSGKDIGMVDATFDLSITGLPPHLGMMISMCFFPVSDANSPVPFDGDPPTDGKLDQEQIVKNMHLDREATETTWSNSIRVSRPAGHYFIQIRIILFRYRDKKVFGQLETFFFRTRPFCFDAEADLRATFPVAWPTTAEEEMYLYQKFSPRPKNPWSKFWAG